MVEHETVLVGGEGGFEGAEHVGPERVGLGPGFGEFSAVFRGPAGQVQRGQGSGGVAAEQYRAAEGVEGAFRDVEEVAEPQFGF